MGLHLHRQRWEELGREDPLWAILSAPERRGGGWDVDEFFRTGEAQIAALLAWLDELSVAPPPRRALDFGSGAGRLTRALAARFEQTAGVDIASSMVALAERHNAHPDRCRFTVYDGRRLPFPAAHFDLVVSFITLQHVPPRAARRALRELARVLAPGGVLAFQEAAETCSALARIPRLLPRPLYELARSVKSLVAPAPDFEMYGLPRTLVERLLVGAGLRIVDVREDHAAGEGWTSFSYVAVKPSG